MMLLSSQKISLYFEAVFTLLAIEELQLCQRSRAGSAIFACSQRFPLLSRLQ